MRSVLWHLTMVTSVASAVSIDMSSQACRLPETMFGYWYEHNTEQAIAISANKMSSKGFCLEMDGELKNRFLFHNQRDDCYQCLYMFNEHRNLLRYKQSSCVRDRRVDLCATIYADRPLHTLFRGGHVAIACPFHLNAASVKQSHCTTKLPHQRLQTCSDSTKFRIRYYASDNCEPEQYSTVDYECIAEWHKQSIETQHYVALKIANAGMERPKHSLYRCMLIKRTSNGGTLSISADGTCRELSSFYGNTPIQLTFEDDAPIAPNGHFADFLQSSKSLPIYWQSVVDGRDHYFIGSSWTCNESTSMLIEQKNIGLLTHYLVYRIDDCKRGFQCVNVRRRSANVIEMTHGCLLEEATIDTACSPENLDEENAVFDTLLVSTAKPSKCPHTGTYSLHSCAQKHSHLRVSCQAQHQFTLSRECDPNNIDTYDCYDNWDMDGVDYLVARDRATDTLVCYMYDLSDITLSLHKLDKLPCRKAVFGAPSTPIVTYNASKLADFCTSASMRSAAKAIITLITLAFILR